MKSSTDRAARSISQSIHSNEQRLEECNIYNLLVCLIFKVQQPCGFDCGARYLQGYFALLDNHKIERFPFGTYINQVIVLAFWGKQTVSNRLLDVFSRSDALVAENEALSPQLGQLQKKHVHQREARGELRLVGHSPSIVAVMSNGKRASKLANLRRLWR